MTEENNSGAAGAPVTPPDNTTTPPGTDPKNQNNGDQGQKPVDLKTLPPEQLAQVLENPNFWQLDRVKDLQEAKKQLKTFQEERQKAEEENLKKKGEWEQVAKTKEEEANSWKTKYTNSVIDNNITIAASKAGIGNIGDALKLIDKSGITLADDGTVSGVDEAVTKLLAASPYLKGTLPATPVGGGTNPNDGSSGTLPTFTHSQIKDPVFYKEHSKEIDEAMRTGRITNDLPQ